MLVALKAEIEFELAEVDISGDPELEARYREWLPVVEIDGERAFVYTVTPAAFRRRLAAQSPARATRADTAAPRLMGGTMAADCHKPRYKENRCPIA